MILNLVHFKVIVIIVDIDAGPDDTLKFTKCKSIDCNTFASCEFLSVIGPCTNIHIYIN